MRGSWGGVLAVALLVLGPPRAGPAACRPSALCVCRGDSLACNYVPFHRFPETGVSVRHVSLGGARLGALSEAALDARPLLTLVLVASRLHSIEPTALQAMTHSLASLDLAHNHFTQIPLTPLKHLKVLNWLNLQNNLISDIEPDVDWGFLCESLTSLSLSNNQLRSLRSGALASLRRLAQLELDGNRLHALAPHALPPSVALLRLSDNLFPHLPCAALRHLPRLSHLHLRNNLLRSSDNVSACHTERCHIDSLDISHNSLDDTFTLDLHGCQIRQLILDLNDFTAFPSFALESGRLEKLSLSYNKLSRITDSVVHSLKHHLEDLDLDHNDISSLPEIVVEMKRLKHLSLAYNQLHEVSNLPPNLMSLSLAGNYLVEFPAGLAGLSPAMLGYLDLGYNSLGAVHYGAWGGWSRALRSLLLRGNRRLQLAADSFPALPLTELVLSFNDLYNVEPSVFANLTMLQVLELSTALFTGELPLDSTFESLTWLTLDNNNIHHFSSDDFRKFPKLEYLNLDFNKITVFPSAVDGANVSYRLKDIRLSYNCVNKINSEFLSSLSELQSVDLSYNRMHNVSERSFTNLQNLVYLSLAGNVVEFIAADAFHDLPKLQVLNLQENSLVELSTNYFRNVCSNSHGLSVNVSSNKIVSLAGTRYVPIRILDLSHNLLETLSRSFFDSISGHLQQLVVAHNRLMYVDSVAFGVLPKLETLNLKNNNISVIKRRAFSEMASLQILDLSSNAVSQLAVEQFHSSRRLRQLRLDRNQLRALPRDCFKNTLLEYVDLSHNKLGVFPGSALAQVGFTLRRLELAGNLLEYLDAAMFHDIAFLYELDLAHNALTVLPDNTFAGLSHLRRLDLSFNCIKANFKELFHNLPRLRHLNLAGTGIKSVPHLLLANLTELNLSDNHISSFREMDVRGLANLRVLNISKNRLTSVQPTMWVNLPKLTSLDVSYNPLVRIVHGSLAGLSRLQSLRMEHLRHLEAVEPRALRALAALRSLALELPVAGGRAPASLAELTAHAPGLQELALRVRESVLDVQLAGLSADKLRMLDVRGAALRRVSARAFTPLRGARALSLRVRHTGVRALPAGLLRPLARVPHLGLDLSDNQLLELSPDTLYPNMTQWDKFATNLLAGGLVVSGNPLRCGCGVSWLGAWLRRWAAEGGRGAGGERTRHATCLTARAAAPRVLLALHDADAECHASALSSRAALLLPSAFFWIVLVHSLS